MKAKGSLLIASLALALLGCDSRNASSPLGQNGKEDALHLDGVEFTNRVLNAEGLALVDFWATWCGPCIKVAPTIETVAEEHKGKTLVGKVDVDKEVELAVRYQIESIPALLLFKDGKVVDKIVGVASQSEIDSMIARHSN